MPVRDTIFAQVACSLNGIIVLFTSEVTLYNTALVSTIFCVKPVEENSVAVFLVVCDPSMNKLLAT